jgi:putative ATP-dependent endonuclease of the OLD family
MGMKLAKIRIKNFRSIEDQTINLDDYTCLVGSNGTGKSTVLQALNVFFRHTAGVGTDVWQLSDEDFHHRQTSIPVEISLTFESLSSEAQEDFKAYYRQDQLVITAKAIWDSAAQVAPVKQYGSRLVMSAFAPFFAAVDTGDKVVELRTKYAKIREQFTELSDINTKSGMIESLHNYETDHPGECELIESSHEFYGWTRGSNLLSKYIQWVYVPAVKDASAEESEETKTALGQLLQRTIRSKVDFSGPIAELQQDIERQYREMLDSKQNVLEGLRESIEKRFRQWATPRAQLRLKWNFDDNKSVRIDEPAARVAIGEDEFIGHVARLGHGLQRAYLVSILQELATSDEERAPTLVLGFEEPELYLHPPQAQHVSNLLESLAREQEHNSQILVTTHSPYFISGRGFEDIRMFRKTSNGRASVVTSATYNDVASLLAAALSEAPGTPTSLMVKMEQIMQPAQRELFFAGLAVLVEGTEDMAFLATHMSLSGKWDKFRLHGCHFVACDGKTNMSRPLAIALRLGIPTFVVFDSDNNLTRQNEVDRNTRDNVCLFVLSQLCGRSSDEIDVRDVAVIRDSPVLSGDTVWGEHSIMWSPKIGDVVRSDFGEKVWNEAEKQAKTDYKLGEGVNQKNSFLIAATLEVLDKQSKRSEQLERACDAILSAATLASTAG